MNLFEHFRSEHFDCDCYSYDHAIRMTFDPTEEDIRFAEFWLDCHFPTDHTLWQRIKLAYKYITKSGSMDYTYGTWMLRPSDVTRLRNLLNEYEGHVQKMEAAVKEKEDTVGHQQEDGV